MKFDIRKGEERAKETDSAIEEERQAEEMSHDDSGITTRYHYSFYHDIMFVGSCAYAG